MTKSDLIEILCEQQKLPKGRAELLINTLFDSMEASLRRGERIEIRGFGSFEIREYKAYEGRNPRTGSAVPVRPKRLPFFKVGKELKERVNTARLPARRSDGSRGDVGRMVAVAENKSEHKSEHKSVESKSLEAKPMVAAAGRSGS